MIDTVYRVQDKQEGLGPYTNYGCSVVYDLLEPHRQPEHPNAIHDKGIQRYADDDEFFGFESMAQLQDWFTVAELEVLYKHDFQIVVLKQVEVTAIGDKQVLFIKKTETELISWRI